MSFEENKDTIHRFASAFNKGQLEIIDRLICRDFYNYVPVAGEESAPDVFRGLAGDLLTAFPDLKVDVSDFVEDGETLTFRLAVSGNHGDVLWGAPASGNHITWISTVTARFAGGKFAFSWQDLRLPDLMGTLREIGMVPPPEEMDKPPKHPITIPEFILKLIFTGQVAEKECSHLDMIQVIEPDTDVCRDCVALGDVWPALRMCLICGTIGCCDTSKNKHMKQHYEKTGHPIFRSTRLQEGWVWCYEDDAFFSKRILERFGE
jgi:predicted ester cyclase